MQKFHIIFCSRNQKKNENVLFFFICLFVFHFVLLSNTSWWRVEKQKKNEIVMIIKSFPCSLFYFFSSNYTVNNRKHSRPRFPAKNLLFPFSLNIFVFILSRFFLALYSGSDWFDFKSVYNNRWQEGRKDMALYVCGGVFSLITNC